LAIGSHDVKCPCKASDVAGVNLMDRSMLALADDAKAETQIWIRTYINISIKFSVINLHITSMQL
jgi:hypothetical protein